MLLIHILIYTFSWWWLSNSKGSMTKQNSFSCTISCFSCNITHKHSCFVSTNHQIRTIGEDPVTMWFRAAGLSYIRLLIYALEGRIYNWWQWHKILWSRFACINSRQIMEKIEVNLHLLRLMKWELHYSRGFSLTSNLISKSNYWMTDRTKIISLRFSRKLSSDSQSKIYGGTKSIST